MQKKKMDDSSVATLELSELFADDILAFLSDIEVEPTNHSHQSSIVGGAEPGPSNPYDGVGLATALQEEREGTTQVQEIKAIELPPPTKRSKWTASKRVFAPPMSAKEIEKAKQKAIPQSTRADTDYCLRVWKEWCQHRLTNHGDVIPPLHEMPEKVLEQKLSSFIFEVRKKNGSEFPPDTLHHIVSGLQRYLRWSGKPSIDLFNKTKFPHFHSCLDAEMTRLQAAGLGSEKRKAEPLTHEEEEILWTKGLLGSHNPQALVDTVLFMNGIYFALRSGDEHRQLRSKPCQIQVIREPGKRPHLRYIEDISKNRPGGLKGRKLKSKVVQHYDNPENPDRCFVRIFETYQKLLPKNRRDDAFYFQPLKKPTADVWFSSKPIGHNTLEQTVARLCSSAGITGFRTNHSLRATAATRLYQAGVDEQMIMETTGHRSLEGVRSYKRTSTSQKENISDILNSQSKPTSDQSSLICNNQLSMQHIQTSQTSYTPPTFNFKDCTVNINFSTHSIH